VLTYGALPIILVTFFSIWWPQSPLRKETATEGIGALWEPFRHHLLTLDGLEKLIHADTMLFILGLTFFVAVISQTRLLEEISMKILRIFEGRVLSTVLVIGGLVSFASGILDGVSMIGLTIRVLVIILVMAKMDTRGIELIIMVSVVLTTVCGMWLAYGEPPNLIMKSNLNLSDAFFLKYAMPMAVVTFLIVAKFMHGRLSGKVISLEDLDVLETNIADVRFLQATRKGATKEIEKILKEYAGNSERRPRGWRRYIMKDTIRFQR
jgi:Na+/H+ antiporter NhaD/arsenite permease-like protein